MLKDWQICADQVAVAPGPHPTLTSWIILPRPSQEMAKQIEGKLFKKGHYSMVSLDVDAMSSDACPVRMLSEGEYGVHTSS